MSNLKRNALLCFKKLHRTRLKVFKGDQMALTAARIKINDEFRKNKDINNEEAVKAMISFAEDVERELRTQVIQAKEMKPGFFEARITEDTLKLTNIPYDDNVVIEKTAGTPCCQNQPK